MVGGSSSGGVCQRGMWWWWWWRWWCLVLVVLAAVTTPSAGYSSTYTASGFSKNVTSLLDSLLADYDRQIAQGHGGPPTTIMVNMNVRSMGPFSEKQESYAMQLYLRQKWVDPRLRFNATDLGKNEFSMNWIFATKLWKPDTFFINGKNSYAHKITAPNTFIRLKYDGQITWSLRLTVRASCKMHLRKFPLDTQICPLSLASYGYNAQDMMYRWAKVGGGKAVTVDSDVSIAQYELGNITTGFSKVTVRRKETISVLSVNFHLKRLTGFFLLQVYIPCILIVCCSWVAFWITKKDVPGRVCLGVNTVLALTKIGFGGRSKMPKVDYPTALDYFVCMCFLNVFGTIVEYGAIVFYEGRAKQRRQIIEDALNAMKKKAKTEEEMKNNMASEKEATMLVTTTVREDGGVDIGTCIKESMKVPLSLVPLSVKPIEEEGDEQQQEEVDTHESLVDALKVPLVVIPQSLDAVEEGQEREGLRARGVTTAGTTTTASTPPGGKTTVVESEEDSGGEVSGIDMSVVSGEIDPILSKREGHLSGSDSGSVTSKGSIFSRYRKDAKMRREKSQDSESDLTVIKVDLQSEDEQSPPPPPPPPFTVWQILTKKQKIMSEMTISNTVPTEEDLLDRFSIIDLYARRIFPTTFFGLFTIYWVLFNYYITDEFPTEKTVPSDGLIVV